MMRYERDCWSESKKGTVRSRRGMGEEKKMDRDVLYRLTRNGERGHLRESMTFVRDGESDRKGCRGEMTG